MGLITIYADPDNNIVYKIILNHDDVATGVINYLNECGKNIPTVSGRLMCSLSPRKYQEETTSAFGGKDITIKYTQGCNVTALSLVNHLRREFGYNLFAVTSLEISSTHYLLYVLDYAPNAFGAPANAQKYYSEVPFGASIVKKLCL
uniref:Uncharacterized protein n=1 Tax=Tetranychus urticae TaxID=32264 RepID=T1JXQ2_TETUR